MSNSEIPFRLRTQGGPCDNNEYRLSVLPRVGEFFENGSHSFRVTHVVHRAYCIPEVFAVPDRAVFGCIGFNA